MSFKAKALNKALHCYLSGGESVMQRASVSQTTPFYSAACPISPIWLWPLKSWAVGFSPFTSPTQDLAVCSVPRPAPPDPWAIRPTPQLWSAASNTAGKKTLAGWPEGCRGRAKGGRRNKNMLLEGQGQAERSLQPFREWWEPPGNGCSHEATHRAVQLNSGDLSPALPQSDHSGVVATPW